MNDVKQTAPAGVRVPELLAPAGDWDCVKAAVETGADAIYFGLDKFNARMRAKNFTVADLPELMAYLHLRGVRGYVTFNTLVFSDELTDAEAFLRSIIAAGVDAAIVQDVGICRLIRRLSPDFPIHASTQMTVSSAGGVAFARELGCELAVLARECSISEIEQIQTETADRDMRLPLEVFVHGALCVAYSGQCLTSESLGGRSANRGECAQACRMPYDLVSDGKDVDLGVRQYLLSPQDLAGLEVVPDLVRAGVTSLKIEGRLKSPEYVAGIVRVYRQALDRCRDQVSVAPTRQDQYEMEMAFSRGLHTGWFRGIDNQRLVHARFGKKRGAYLGTVSAVRRETVTLKLEEELKAGDGIVFDHGTPGTGEEGGRVFQIFNGKDVTFRQGAVDFSKIYPGDRVWKTDDPELKKEVRASYEGDRIRHRRPVFFEVCGAKAEALSILARDEQGHVAQAKSEALLTPAEKRPLTEDVLREQLGRLGSTPFEFGGMQVDLPGGLMLPLSELNRMRREVIVRLEELRRAPKRWQMSDGPAIERLRSSPARRSEPELIVQIREPGQLDAVLDAGIRTVYCDFEFPKKYRETVARFRERAMAGTEIFVAPPRIFKPGEEWILKQVRECGPDGFLVRNFDHLRYFEQDRRRGDFSLNVANELTADWFRNRHGLERLTASYDLNNVQLEALMRAAPPEWFEVTIHQHMPMFHMEHCVFCAFLSTGKDYRDCGRPCESHVVKIRDRVGLEHPLKADAGCRNTVYNARAQTGAESVEQLTAAGVRNFRIDLMDETPAEIRRVVSSYQSLLRGELSGGQLWRELKLHSQLGVTRGQQFVSA